MGGRLVDGRRFDDLTKNLVAATPSRRGVLRGLVGGALAAVFGGVTLERAMAQEVGTEATDLICENQTVLCNAARRPAFVCGTGCACARQTNGDKRCVQAQISCREQPRCRRNRDCGRGEVCIEVEGCTDPECQKGRGRCAQRCTS